MIPLKKNKDDLQIFEANPSRKSVTIIRQPFLHHVISVRFFVR